MVRASYSRSCEHDCGDQRGRQNFKLGHSNSPLYLKSRQRVAPLMEMEQRSTDQSNICARRFNAARDRCPVRSFTQLELPRRIDLCEAQFSGTRSLPPYMWLDDASEHSEGWLWEAGTERSTPLVDVSVLS
jgi:hypothetical protein